MKDKIIKILEELEIETRRHYFRGTKINVSKYADRILKLKEKKEKQLNN